MGNGTNTDSNVPVKTLNSINIFAIASFEIHSLAIIGTVYCVYYMSPDNHSVPASGGTCSFTIVATSGCLWTTQSSDSRITITFGSSGLGNGSGAYSVSSNTGTSSRTGYIHLKDSNGNTVDTLTITQEGAPNTCQQELGDVNMNGNITSYDAYLILQYVVGLYKNF